MNEEVKKNLKEIKRYENLINKYHVKLRLARTNLQVICPHEDKQKSVKHYEGGYLNCGSYEYKTTCNTCGLVLATKTESDGSYA